MLTFWPFLHKRTDSQFLPWEKFGVKVSKTTSKSTQIPFGLVLLIDGANAAFGHLRSRFRSRWDLSGWTSLSSLVLPIMGPGWEDRLTLQPPLTAALHALPLTQHWSEVRSTLTVSGILAEFTGFNQSLSVFILFPMWLSRWFTGACNICHQTFTHLFQIINSHDVHI